MLVWALKHWRIIAIVFVVLALLGTLWRFGQLQYQKGWNQCTREQEKAEIEGVKTHGKIQIKNNRATISDIDRRLIANWLRPE